MTERIEMANTSIGAMIRREIPPGDVPEHARRIQEAFDELWVVEDLPYAGGISQVAAVLDATTDVVVGHGIAPAPFRNPVALAMEWSTLAELHPGRFSAGIGHGVQGWMDQIGDRVESPLTLLRESVEALRRLMAGETVSVDGRYVQIDDVALEFPPDIPPLVSTGVSGPRSLRLSGAVAEGTILAEKNGPVEIRTAAGLIAEGQAEAGVIGHHRLTVFGAFYVGDLEDLPEKDQGGKDAWAAIATRPDAVSEQLQSLIDAGADALILVPIGRKPADQLHLAAEEIVPALIRA
jgi:alkanesulfonate monooxygenase SsuD/methylene tetrahydromethanopterin reductase-like flavin-dependent oxidoreductase (luciferase family)